MSGKSSRDKGLNFEREIAQAFREFYPEARRHLEFQFEEADGVDLDNTGDWFIQCKRNKAYCSISKIDEIKRKGGRPLLITKGDRKPAMVAFELKYFLAMERRIKMLEEKNNSLHNLVVQIVKTDDPQ